MVWSRRGAALAATFCIVVFFGMTTTVIAQEITAAQEDHAQVNMPAWQFMQDGIVFAEFNRQGGPRGGKEFVVPNWWMGMAARSAGRGMVTFTSMLSLDAATVGKEGYREIFQVGETLDGAPIVDRQHPHDLFMQLSGSWRIPITTVAPHVRFHAHRIWRRYSRGRPWRMAHRRIGLQRPRAGRTPLGLRFRRARFRLRACVAPADRSVGIPGLDGHLKNPQELEPGNIQRTTTSGSWFKSDGDAGEAP